MCGQQNKKKATRENKEKLRDYILYTRVEWEIVLVGKIIDKNERQIVIFLFSLLMIKMDCLSHVAVSHCEPRKHLTTQ